MTRRFKSSYLKFSLLAFLLTIAISASAQTVYITKTGAKYHKESCRYLKYSSIAITLTKAQQQGYTACSVCKPSSDTNTIRKAPASQSVQCSAITQAGTRCKRSTTYANGRCWQHQ